ncbi:Sepiapterin reductase [Holothuria leucospilota]|uniref:Sepiapterin reductase n=1 Tax=Holothuria leucospilota TaxID=206669 RepID=A0A9Q0YLW8_HOLLE|nr:Sepiapterin reductase [Holothuria leucospilota]
MSILNVQTMAIITGASRGIGRAIAISLAKRVSANSCLYLTADDEEGLKETANIIKRNVSKTIRLTCIPADLDDEKNLEKLGELVFDKGEPTSNFSHAIFINNAASKGPIEKYTRQLGDIELIKKHYPLNLTTPVFLTSKFLQKFEKDNIRKTIINCTTPASKDPQHTLHLYCMGKAGCDMFFRVVALEEPNLRVLLYDTGIVDTVMFRGLENSAEASLRAKMKYLTEQSFFIKPEQSAEALLKTLEDDNFESGATVCCYDVMGINYDLSPVTQKTFSPH